MSDLKPGDYVKIKPLNAIGQIKRITISMRHTPYLVEIHGVEARGYSADELERLPPPQPLMTVNGALVCGTTNCLRVYDPTKPVCPKCGRLWVAP